MSIGGFKAMYFESVIAAFGVKWLKECISQFQSIWYQIPNNIFNRVDEIALGLKFLLSLFDFHEQALHFGRI